MLFKNYFERRRSMTPNTNIIRTAHFTKKIICIDSQLFVIRFFVLSRFANAQIVAQQA